MGNLCDELLDLKRKDFGSIDHRKNLSNFFVLNTQEVLDLPRREFKTLVIGLIKGRVYGKLEVADEAKTYYSEEYFMVPIGMWQHREEDFKKILKEEIDELKANEERNDDSSVETESDGEAETENSEEL